jgi:hypothetical protein
MTPQTAAALRALVTEIRAYEGDPFGTAKHEFQEWADRLAAVLARGRTTANRATAPAT